MQITEEQRYKITKTIKELEKYRGSHTELVTVYIPAGYEITKIINHLAQEQGTASNIKSSATRKNVTNALERMIQHLRLFPQTPPHGLAAFSGNVAEREGQSDVKVWSIEPPVPLNIRLYRCDKTFIMEPLRDMAEIKEVYGLVVMDRRECNIAFLKGKTIIHLSHETSNVPGKTRAGGQSSNRYQHIREDAAKEFFKKCADMMKEKLFTAREELKGIIVGGPGPTKYEFIENHDYVVTELKNKIIAIKDTSYTGQFGIQELVDLSEDVLMNESVMEEKRWMNKFFDFLNKDPDFVTYGEAHVKEMVERGAVEMILLSEAIGDQKIEDWLKLAEQFSTKVQMISTETREGQQLKDIGMIAAILRYKQHW